MEIDYENDWSGEQRIDPDDGNAYVLRSIMQIEGEDGPRIVVNDIFGGHSRIMYVSKWLTWERV
jgi:hypothetical protein